MKSTIPCFPILYSTYYTMQHWAGMHGNAKHITVLLKYSADPSIVDVNGRTILHLAAENAQGSTCITYVLYYFVLRCL